MLIKKPEDIKSSEITPESIYANRRLFMKGAAIAATVVGTGFLYRRLNPASAPKTETAKLSDLVATSALSGNASNGFKVGEKQTSFEDITNYNNFYEFDTDKQSVAAAAAGFVTRPWSVAVDGLVNKPKVFDLDDILKVAPREERIYRHRCVEGWSMVIPWAGFSLAELLKRVEPLSTAKYVAFETLFDPKRMPNQSSGVLDWPYVEGLRIDEAMHPLALLASGLYGRELPPQDGAPIRLVVPWKYGFKSIKSIVKIKLVDAMPPTTWNIQAPDEYGFYSNVNPNVDHPRWSQKHERRIGEFGQRETLPFNGYSEQVASMYSGMDLRAFF
jgi:sulfoxide reductase catalytic subunit YedY